MQGLAAMGNRKEVPEEFIKAIVALPETYSLYEIENEDLRDKTIQLLRDGGVDKLFDMT